ncbi:MAG: PTS sugar transporter subunit IIA [Planctomycetota bacterium]
MRLGDFILEESIISDLRAETKPEALAEIVRSVVQAGCINPESAGSVIEALLHREEIGSTGIGHGVAIPHAKHQAVRRLIGAYAHSARGVDFAAVDGAPARSIFLLLWPDGVIGPHLEGIALVSQMLKRDNFLERLKVADNKTQIVDLFAEADKDVQG